MTRTRTLVLGAVLPAMLLCGCAKKCSFADFQKSVSEIKFNEDDLESVTVKGKITDDGKVYEIAKTKFSEDTKDEDVSEEASLAFGLLIGNYVGLYSIYEDKSTTYYAGSSYKIEKEGLKMEWEKHGLCTSIEGEYKGYTVELSASYGF